MDDLWRQLTTHEEILAEVEVLSILTAPGYLVIRDLTRASELQDSTQYVQLERSLYNSWQHNPNNSFDGIPGPGTLVMATDDTKWSYKRGIILKIEPSFDGVNLYYIFLYDWGRIMSFKLRQISRLPEEFRDWLPPRTILLIQAGVVKFNEEWERFPEQRKKIEEQREKLRLKGTTDKRFKMAREFTEFTQHWLNKRLVKIRSFRSFYDVIHYGELLGWDTERPTRGPEYLADETEKQGFTVLCPYLLDFEKQTDPEFEDPQFLDRRLQSIQCTEVCAKRLKRKKKEAERAKQLSSKLQAVQL